MNLDISNSEIIEEIEICRLCINSSSSSIQIKYYTITESIQQQVFELLTITIDSNDAFICENCLQHIINFANFKEKCISNQQFFQKPLEVKNEIELVLEDEFDLPDQDNLYKPQEENAFKRSKRKVRSKKLETPNSSAAAKRKSERKQKGKEIYQKLLSPCEFCGKLIEKNRMEGHRNQHLGIRPYSCDLDDCNKTFHCKHLLRLHKTTMHTGNQITCNVCGKLFPSKRSLYAHSMRHQNKDKFSCDLCEKKFNTRNSLRRHMPSHTGIRNFKCSHCSMAFYRNYNLLVHIRTHTKEKRYICPVCEKPFSYRRLMKEHVMKAHPSYDIELLNVNSSKYVKLSKTESEVEQNMDVNSDSRSLIHENWGK